MDTDPRQNASEFTKQRDKLDPTNKPPRERVALLDDFDRWFSVVAP